MSEFHDSPDVLTLNYTNVERLIFISHVSQDFFKYEYIWTHTHLLPLPYSLWKVTDYRLKISISLNDFILSHKLVNICCNTVSTGIHYYDLTIIIYGQSHLLFLVIPWFTCCYIKILWVAESSSGFS